MSFKLNNISKYYGSFAALKNLSLTFDSNGIYGLLGPNGAGKSTMMKIITGFLYLDGGTIEYKGKNINPTDKSWKKKLGYLPENNPLFESMLVGEYLLLMSGIHEIKRETARNRIKEYSLKLDLTKRLGDPISSLSKGLKQRVGIMASILHDPEILILDEPTAGLDPLNIPPLHKFIEELAEDRIIIFSTHILPEAERLCKLTYLLNKAELAGVYGNEPNRQKVVFEFDKSQEAEILSKNLKRLEISFERAENCVFIMESEDIHKIKTECLKLIYENGLELRSMKPETNSLQEAFLKLENS